MEIAEAKIICSYLMRRSTLKEAPFHIEEKELLSGNEKRKLLWKGIIDGSITNDMQGAVALYGKKDMNAFRIFKTRFVKDLLLSVLFVCDNPHNDYANTLRVLYVLKAEASFLAFDGVSNTAKRLFVKALRIAEELQTTAEQVYITHELILLCGDLGQWKERTMYQQQYKTLLETNVQEMEAEDIARQKIRSISEKKNTLEQANAESDAKALARLDSIRKKYPTAQNQLYYHRFAVMKAQTENDIDALLQYSTQMHNHYDAQPQAFPPVILGEFGMRQANILSSRKQRSAAKKVYKQVLGSLNKGSANYLSANCNYILTCMHEKEFALSHTLLLESLAYPRFMYLHERVQNIFKLLHLTLQSMQCIGKYCPRSVSENVAESSSESSSDNKSDTSMEAHIQPHIEPHIETPPPSTHYIRTSLQNLRAAKKDLTGVKPMMLVLDYMLLIAEAAGVLPEISSPTTPDEIRHANNRKAKALDTLIAREESLKTYRKRYLRGVASRRGYLLTSMMLTVIRENFHRPTVEHAIADSRKELALLPITGIETLTFETVVEIVLNLLDRIETVRVKPLCTS